MLLTIKTSDGISLSVELPSERTIGELLVEVAQKLNVKTENIRLVTKDAYLYDNSMNLNDYKLFHGQTLFLLNRAPGPVQVNSESNELSDTKRTIEACFARLREDSPTAESSDTRNVLLVLLTKLSQKYNEMSQELTVCADLLSRPNNTSIPAHWKDLAAFRRKAFVVSEVTSAVSSILYGSTLATSAALAQGQPQSQFIIPPTINTSWSKTFDSFGQERRADYSSRPNSPEPGLERPFNFSQLHSLYSQLDGHGVDDTIFDSIIMCVKTLTCNLVDLPQTMTLDRYFNIPTVNGGMFYELTSKVTVATALEVLSGSVNRLDESLLILKRLLQARSTDHQFYIMYSFQLASQWFSFHNQPSELLNSLLFRLHKITSEFLRAIFFEIGFSAVTNDSGENLSPHQFTLLAAFNCLTSMHNELTNEAITQDDWTHLLRHSFAPIAKSLLPHLGMAMTLSLLSIVLPQARIHNLSRSLLTC